MTMVALPANPTTLLSRPLLIPVFEEAVVALYVKTVGPATGACHARGGRMAGPSISEGQCSGEYKFHKCGLTHRLLGGSHRGVYQRGVCQPAAGVHPGRHQRSRKVSRIDLSISVRPLVQCTSFLFALAAAMSFAEPLP
jgi:hypothetical protein